MENIRKVVHRRQKESKFKYKQLSSLAIDCTYKEAMKIRESEDKEFKKFQFFNNLMLALDKGDMKENGF